MSNSCFVAKCTFKLSILGCSKIVHVGKEHVITSKGPWFYVAQKW